MHALKPFSLVFLLPFCSCADEHAAVTSLGQDGQREVFAAQDIAVFDVAQSTCALYVAVRSGALQGPIAFGRDLDDITIHWNKCSTGNMVACASAATANGDTIVTGIPFPY